MPSSVCVDAGTSSGAPAVDFAENARSDGSIDMGCHEAAACTEVSDAGSIASAQQNCGTFDPAAFTDGGAPNGSGGTLTYVWQNSSDDATWSDIGSSNAATYDPGSTSSDTYFRRGAYRCASGGIQYTSSLLVDIVATPNAGTLSGTQAINPTSAVTVTSSGDGGGAWSSNNGFVTIDSWNRCGYGSI